MGKKLQTRKSPPTPRADSTPAPNNHVRLTRNDLYAAAGVWLIAFVVYLLTLAPTVTGEDSGELITAAYTLGIPHPPGYPLWCMLGKLFTLIVPVGSIAWRVGLMSAFWGASAAAVISLLVIKLTRNRAAAVAAALIFAFSRDFWGQCTIAETYTLNAFLIAACILLLVSYHETRRTSLLYAFAAVYGLGLCNHHTMHFLGPLFALYILSSDYLACGGNLTAPANSAKNRTPSPFLFILHRWRAYLVMPAIALAVWALIHLYLPIRSMANPVMDWGNPETWDNFWSVVLRRQYGSLGLVAKENSIARFIGQTYIFTAMYVQQFTPFLAILPLLGLRPLYNKNRHTFWFITATTLYLILGFILILNSENDRQSLWVNAVFFIPAYMLCAILAGVGLNWLISQIPVKTLKTAAIVGAALLPLFPLIAHYRANDKSQYYFAYDNAMNIFRTLEPNAVYFPSGDHRVFPLIYLQAVEGVRPDVTIADKYGYIEEHLYEKMPAPMRAQLSKPVALTDLTMIEEWIVANDPRPIFISKKSSYPNVPGAAVTQTGLAYKVVRKGEQPPDPTIWDKYQWHTLDPAETRGEFSADVILSDYHFFLGQHYFANGESEKAIEQMNLAMQAIGRCEENLTNIGIICVENSQYEAGKTCYEAALEANPNHLPTLRNLSRLSYLMDDSQKAHQYIRHAATCAEKQLGPYDPIVAACYSELAIILREADLGSPQEIVDFSKRALDAATAVFGPTSPNIAIYLNNLGVASYEKGDIGAARYFLEQALDIEQKAFGPNHPNVGRDLSNLSIVMKEFGKLTEASKMREQAVRILKAAYGPDHYHTKSAIDGTMVVSLGK